MKAFVIKTKDGKYRSVLAWLFTNGLTDEVEIISKASFYDTCQSAIGDKHETDFVYQVNLEEADSVCLELPENAD